MIRLFANANYDFIKWRRWAYGITAAVIIPGFSLFLIRGLNYSMRVHRRHADPGADARAGRPERIRGALDAAGIRDAEIQQFGAANEYVVRARIGRADAVVEGSTETTAAAVDSALARPWAGAGALQDPAHRGRRPQGRPRAPEQGLPAILLSFLVTLAYLAVRFECASASPRCSRRVTTSSARSRSSATLTSR